MGRLNFGSFGHAKQKPRGPAASLKTSHTTTAGFRSAAVPTESLRVAGCPSKRRPSPQRAFAAPGASSTSASGISARDGIAPKAQSVLLTDAEHAPSRDSRECIFRSSSRPRSHPSRYQLASCHRSRSQPEMCAVSLPPSAATRVREMMGWM